MDEENRSLLHQALLSRCDAIADSWFKAIARTSFVPLVAAEVRQQLVQLTEQAVAFLLAESSEHGRAEAIGASLASLHYTEPAGTGRTQEVLAQQLLEGLPADQVVALQPRLAALLGGVAEGFLQQSRETILSQQETIRGALIGELQQAQQALEKAYGEVEQQVQHRTAELRAANESLRREIVERKQAEEALRESEETARALLNAPTTDVAALIDTRGVILDANEAMAQRFGKHVDELTGLYGWDLIPPDIAKRRKPYFDQAVVSGAPVRFEDERSGTWFDNVIYPICDAQGKVTKVAVLARDITERKRAEEALRKAHDALEMRVQERTAELAKANEALRAEIIVRKRAEEALRRERDLAEALAEAAAIVSSTLDPDQVLDRILEQVSRVVPNDAANIMLIEGSQVHMTRWRGYERLGAEEFVSTLVFRAPELPTLQQMRKSEKPIVIPDTATYSDWVHVPEMEWLRSYAAAPIVVRDQVVGFLNVDSAAPSFFTQAHAEALRAFADHAAIAIENAQLYEAARREITERKRAEEALQKSEELLRLLFENASEGIIIFDNQGNILDANPALMEFLPLSHKEVVGHHFTDILTALNLDSEKALASYQRIISEIPKVRALEWEIINAEGKPIILAVRSSVIKKEDEILGFSIFADDITERKRAEEELIRLSSAVKTSVDSIVIVDVEGKIIDVNEAALKMYGIDDKGDLIGQHSLNLVAPEQRENGLAGIEFVLEKGYDKSRDYEIITKDGGRIPVELSASAMKDADGKPIGIVIIARDITERKRAEEELRESEATMRALLNAPIEAATLIDANGIVHGANEAAAKRLGKSIDELIGVCIYDLFPPAVAKFRKAQADKVFRSGTPVRFEDEHESRFYDNNLYPVFGTEGKVARIAVYTRDITPRRQADERIRTYQERLRSLASQLSLTEERERRRIATALHDRVGQTLAICKIQLGALRQSASSTELAEPLEEIHKYIEDIIRDTRSLTFELSSLILYQLGLEAALEWLTEQTQKRYGILAKFKDDRQLKPLDDDVRIVLYQAVRELLFNVVKHAQAQHVEVAMEKVDNFIRIMVEDDGVGFDALPIGSDWSEIKGFGLFSIRERLGHLGGQLQITSEPGLGTQVTLLAPLRRDGTTERREMT